LAEYLEMEGVEDFPLHFVEISVATMVYDIEEDQAELAEKADDMDAICDEILGITAPQGAEGVHAKYVEAANLGKEFSELVRAGDIDAAGDRAEKALDLLDEAADLMLAAL